MLCDSRHILRISFITRTFFLKFTISVETKTLIRRLRRNDMTSKAFQCFTQIKTTNTGTAIEI